MVPRSILISRLTEINQCPLLIQSGREVGRLGVTNGSILDPKCDIPFILDGLLGAGEAMRRREFIAFVGCTAAAWPLVARAEQSVVPVIGFLNSASPEPFANYVSGFRVGLKQTGYIDGQNVAIEFRWASAFGSKADIAQISENVRF